MKIKKIPYYIGLLLLTLGASINLGFLSFGGMYVLVPTLSLAIISFVLSVAYEGEIYLQNIKGALAKLFKTNHLERQVAKKFLLNHFPALDDQNTPDFFRDYHKQLLIMTKLKHAHLDANGKKQKKWAKKTLSDMENWFALELTRVNSHQSKTEYQRQLQNWLEKNGQDEIIQELSKRRHTLKYIKLFSLISALFMSLGTTYLLVDAFAVLPYFATISPSTLPFIIVPIAIIAGSAYGLLSFNAITDMINNDTLGRWYKKIRQIDLANLNARTLFLSVSAIVLFFLAIALTICTAGTWWTVVQETKPLFSWMSKMPKFIMVILNPLITGISAIFFNLQNSSESLELIEEMSKTTTTPLSQLLQSIRDLYYATRQQENWLQLANPFRLLLNIIMKPLRIVLFLGHLVSIGVTADRLPGVSKPASAMLGIISEGFEDAHYFIGHDHHGSSSMSCHDHHDHHDHHEHHDAHHGHDGMHSQHQHDHTAIRALLNQRLDHGHSHNHDIDLPTRLLKFLFLPIYCLASLWDMSCSQFNSETDKKLSLSEAWNRQTGSTTEDQQLAISPSISDEEKPSNAWKTEHAVFRIQRYKEKKLYNVWIGNDLAKKTGEALTSLQDQLCTTNNTHHVLEPMKTEPHTKHRFFSDPSKETSAFLEELTERINGPHR
ncbi:MAG: hypothetical protein ACOVQX_02235 [Legionella sp.]